jgi:hypothetical protein
VFNGRGNISTYIFSTIKSDSYNKLYPLFFKDKVQYCPGEVCDVKSKQDIQKTSWAQLMILLIFIAFITTAGILFNYKFSIKPHALFGEENNVQTE